MDCRFKSDKTGVHQGLGLNEVTIEEVESWMALAMLLVKWSKLCVIESGESDGIRGLKLGRGARLDEKRDQSVILWRIDGMADREIIKGL